MYQHFVFDPALTKPDLLVLQNLVQDVKDQADHKESVNAVVDNVRNRAASVSRRCIEHVITSPTHFDVDKSSNSRDELTIQQLEAFNNPQNKNFEPTVFVLANFDALHIPDWIDQRIIQPYIKWARTVARVDTDVVMVSHLLLYFTTSVPSAFYLFHHFSWTHAILHFIMQMYYVGTYTLIKHQHIHQGGLLSKNWSAVDTLFPYLLDPLFGHSWNSYYYHHVKHHHVEGNGPNDLSSTIEYQRDDIFNLLHYIFRFYFLIWLDLPLYFIRTRRPKLAFKTAFWDISTYLSIYTLATRVNFRATLFVFILPLAILRLGLMMGNWGQHAFIDELEPDSDFRSSITLIDVQVSPMSMITAIRT